MAKDMNNYHDKSNLGEHGNKLTDELEEVFHDALDFIPADGFRKSQALQKVQFCVGEDLEELKTCS